MNQNLKNYLIDYNKSNDYGISDLDLIETLREGKEVYREHLYGNRWWETWLHVINIKNKYIGYEWAVANRDESIFDLGWEFSWDSVQEYQPKEILKTIYILK